MSAADYARLIRFLGSGYAPKAAQDSPRKPYDALLTPKDKRELRKVLIKPE